MAEKNTGALANDPKNTKAPSGPSVWRRTGPGTYVDQYGNKKTGQAKAPTKDMSKGKGQPQQTGPQQPTTQEVAETGFRGASDLYGQMQQRFQGFDPYQVQSQYNPVFSQEMERARQNVMSQFERRNAEEFQRQDLATQQQIAERGLDPNSPAAQALMKQNTQRQDLARQEAMSSAEQAAMGVQQQMYGQAMGTATMPYDIYSSTFAPTYMAGIGQAYGQQNLQQQQEYAKELAALQNKYSLQQIKATPRGGGGGGGPQLTPYEQMEINSLNTGYNQGQQPNPMAQGIQGFVSGATGQVTNRLNQR
jgi:hypothetical protein